MTSIGSESGVLLGSGGCEAESEALKAAKSARAWGYLRVSTQDQADSGAGLDAQQAAIETASTRLGLTLVQTFTDAAVSGGLALEYRPALLAAIDLLRPNDVLIVSKRDRLGRDLLHVSMIQRLVERKGARIVSAAGEGTDDDGPTSVLMRQIIDAFAQYERAIIRSRTRAALQALKKQGRRVGHLPFGWQLADDGRMLEIHADEQKTLTLIRQLRRDGYTLARIAGELNARGLKTRRGNDWYHQSICQLLDRHPTGEVA